MLETNPHVKYIRICERTDYLGRRIDALIIDTNIQIEANQNMKDDCRIVEIAANVKEFQMTFRDLFGSFKCIEVMGNKQLLLDGAA